MGLFSKKPMGLEFAPILTAFKDKPETLASAASAWSIKKRREKSKPTAQSVYRDDDGRILDWANPTDKEKIILQMADASIYTKESLQCIDDGLCTNCEKPITGIFKEAKTGKKVNFGTYMYYQIYTHTGLCIECIEEFLRSIMATYQRK